MLHRIARGLSAGYMYIGFGIILLEAGFTFMMMFVLPPLAITMVFVGLITLLAVMGGSKVMGGIEHAFARSLLQRGSCARCGGEVISHSPELEADDIRWECAQCRTLFSSSGAELASPAASPAISAVLE
jgi:hypothetical protein